MMSQSNCPPNEGGTLSVYVEHVGAAVAPAIDFDDELRLNSNLQSRYEICSDKYAILYNISDGPYSYTSTTVTTSSGGDIKDIMCYYHLHEAWQYLDDFWPGNPMQNIHSIQFKPEFEVSAVDVQPKIQVNIDMVEYSVSENQVYAPLAEDAYAIVNGFFQYVHLIETEELPARFEGINYALGNYFAQRYMIDKGFANGTTIFKHGGSGADLRKWKPLELRVDDIQVPVMPLFDYYTSSEFEFESRVQVQSELLSACLWELTSIVGIDKVDDLVISSLSEMTDKITSQAEAAAVLFKKAKELNFSKDNLAAVYEIFVIPYGNLFTSFVDVDDVLYFNSLYRLPYLTYYDIDQDGQFNNDDYTLSGIRLHLDPDGFVLSNRDHSYALITEEGTYTLTYDTEIEPDWQLTSGQSSFTFDVDSNYTSHDTFLVGLYPSMPISEVRTFVHSEALRCNEESTISIILKNKGNTVAQDIEVKYDGPTDDIIPIFDLLPGDEKEIEINFTVPGPPDIAPGDAVTVNASASYLAEAVWYETDTVSYEGLILCSYDPNDKLVYPDRVDSLIFSDELLYYTVRFQNTGNAEAFKVEIRDTLDGNLDLTTFEVVGSSHIENLSTIISVDGEVSFLFANINLPDSTSNPEGSQGYVSYEVQPKPALEVSTEIHNTASIYFDSNPAIVTNTTMGYIYHPCDDGDPCTVDDRINKDGICIGIDTCDIVLTKEVPFGITLYPNPTESKIFIESLSSSIKNIRLHSFEGREIYSKKDLNTDTIQIDISDHPKGVYILQVEYENGISVYRKVMRM